MSTVNEMILTAAFNFTAPDELKAIFKNSKEICALIAFLWGLIIIGEGGKDYGQGDKWGGLTALVNAFFLAAWPGILLYLWNKIRSTIGISNKRQYFKITSPNKYLG